MDVYVNDENETVYNIEMQRGKKKELPKRSRYYQGSIDLDLISSGEQYSKLRKTYVIFICTFDPFSSGRHIYTFENLCLEEPIIGLGDETTKLFLNTKGTQQDIDTEMKEFLAYIENSTDEFVQQIDNSLVRTIHRKVRHIKQSKEMEVEYMTLRQRDLENIELGREEGREQGQENMAALMKILLQENRMEDLKRVIDDADFRKKLFTEYHITETKENG